MYLSQYCDVCSDISNILWQLDKPSATDELIRRLQFIHLGLASAEGSFKEICDHVQGLDLALDVDAFITCLKKISTLKFSDNGTVAENTHELFSHLTINDFQVDTNLLANDISKMNVGSLGLTLKR